MKFLESYELSIFGHQFTGHIANKLGKNLYYRKIKKNISSKNLNFIHVTRKIQ
jgi:hypothetical protein